jgi:hypothetical protein
LKLIKYNGGIRPDYDNLDKDLQYSLRVEMVAKNGNWRSLHPDLGIMTDSELMQMPMHGLHTYTACKQIIITAREDAALYTKGIYVASGVIEKVCTQFGFNMPEGFTEGNLLFSSLFKKWAGNIAIDHAIASGAGESANSGLLGGFSPHMQFGMVFIGSFTLYCGLQLVLGEKAKIAYKTLSEINQTDIPSLAFGQSETPNPAPFSAGAPNQSGDGFMSMLNKASGFMQLASKFMGGSDEKPTEKARPKEQRRAPSHRR